MSSKHGDWRGIAITGASGGLGAALAEALAAPGRTFLLLGRDADRLDAAAARVRARGGAAEVAGLPLDDADATTEAIRRFDAGVPLDLLVANAGVKTGNRAGSERAEQTARVLQVNLAAAISTVEAVLPAMRARGRGRVALTGSMAGVAPVGDLLSYAASKAGVHAYAKGLRRTLRGTGVEVTLLVPGFVDTPMTARHDGPTPLLLSPETAAARFADGLAKGRRTVVAPRRLWWASKLGEALPGPWADRAVSRYRAHIAPDPDEASVTGEPPATP